MTSSDKVLTKTKNWLTSIVIGLNLCPFSKAVMLKDQIRYRVCETDNTNELLAILDEELRYLIETPATEIDTSLMIMPNAVADFNDFLDLLYLAEQYLQQMNLTGVIQIASFHPNYQFSETQSEDIENFTNRSPYPTFHLIREESLSRAIQGLTDPSKIYKSNQETMRKIGHAGWQALMKKINN